MGAVVGGVALAPTAVGASQETIEYTLVVEDASGSEVGRTTLTDATDVGEYGEHVSFQSLGDTGFDGDHGYIDYVRFEDGDVIEDWEERDIDDYTLSNDPTGGAAPFEVVSEPVANGNSALDLYTSSGATQYTSNTDVLELSEGDRVQGAIRHETDESGTYAMKLGFRVGDDADGEGGIHVQMVNPGTERTAGVKLRTPNGEAMVEFEPNLQEYYTVSVQVGEDPSAEESGLGGLPGFGVLAGLGALGALGLGGALHRVLED